MPAPNIKSMYGFVLWILKCKECNIVYSWLAVVVEAGYAYTCVVTAGGGLICRRNDDGKREFLYLDGGRKALCKAFPY